MDNSANNGAGAMFNGSAHSVQLERTAWLRNSAGGGGAIQNYGNLSAHCTLFQSNTARYGAALLNDRGGTITVTASKFASNTAIANPPEEWGGDIYNLSGTVTATGNEWVDGPKVNHAGGATPVNTANPQPFDASGACAPLAPEPPLDDDCSDYTLDVITASRFQERGLTQEAEDMKAVATLEGLYLHEGPTLNARRLGILVPWGSNVTVQHRMTFAQTAFPDQVWYSIQYGGQSGWIAARIEDKSYLEGVDADSDACSQLDAPSTLTFTYDRMSAARYAIAHSYQNNITSRPATRVTQRLEEPFNSQFDVPFANFYYSDLGEASGTGSAVFVSESIWAGGLPMTVGLPNSCGVAPGPHDEPGFGWRYCSEGGLTSPTWDFHQYLVNYYTTGSTPLPSAPSGGFNFTVLGEAEQGGMLTFSGTRYADRLTAADFAGLVYLSGGTIQDAPSLAELARAHLAQLRQGDYMWINSVLPANDCHPNVPGVSCGDLHGLVIVGWSTPRNCSDAMGEISPLSAFSTALPGLGDYVPYVADFTYVQQPVARPFYCTRFDQTGRLNFADHDWFFYTILSTGDSVALSPSEVHVDPRWEWSESDG